MSVTERLASGIAALGLSIPPEIQAQLLQYLELVRKWNRVHNLTAVREPETMVVRHLLDSLAILPHIRGVRIADVGSGAGLPGIPLALARPDWHVALIESNHKKSAFLQQARIELEMKNIEVVSERVENIPSGSGFDTVVSRAFSDLADFVGLAGHLCAIEGGGGRLVAMKGVCPHEELAQISPQFAVEKALPLAVPGLDSRRHLIFIKRA